MEWSEIGPLLFACEDERHQCGPRCTLEPIDIGGLECCPVSRMGLRPVMGKLNVNDDEDGDVVPTMTRAGILKDPLDVDGQRQLEVTAKELYAKLFQKCMTTTNYREELERALQARKIPAAELKTQGKELRKFVMANYITTDELTVTTNIAMALSRLVDDDFVSLLCAVLTCQSDAGLMYRGRVVIKPSPKLALLMPKQRQLTLMGIRARNVGDVAIRDNVQALAELLEVKPRDPKSLIKLDLGEARKRIKL